MLGVGFVLVATSVYALEPCTVPPRSSAPSEQDQTLPLTTGELDTESEGVAKRANC